MYEYEYNTLVINKDKFEIISIVETLQQVDIFIVKRKKDLMFVLIVVLLLTFWINIEKKYSNTLDSLNLIV